MRLTAFVKTFLMRLMVILTNVIFCISYSEKCQNLENIGKEVLILKSLRTAGLVAKSMDSEAVLLGFRFQH